MTGFRTQGLDHVALSVRDLDASERWYREVLGLERVHADVWDVPRFLVANGSGLALFPARGDEGGEPAIRVLHLAFRVDRASLEAARQALRERGIDARFENHADVAHSLYFADPDGHRLELTTYEL